MQRRQRESERCKEGSDKVKYRKKATRKYKMQRRQRESKRCKEGNEKVKDVQVTMGVKDRQKHKVSRKKKTESASDIWRRVEQTGLDNTLKKIATVKGELKVISREGHSAAGGLWELLGWMLYGLKHVTHHVLQPDIDKNLPVLRGHSGEEVRFRMSTYKELGGSFVDPSPMALRRPLLDSLQLTEDHTLQSDIYYIEGLKVTEEVIVQFPLFSVTPVKGIYLMVRDNGAWSKVEDPEVVTSEDGAVVVFRTTSCEAFTALSQSCPDRFAAGPAGAEYVSSEHSKVGVIVPKDCFDTEVELDIKVEEFDKQKHSYHFIGIECASVALTISCGNDVKMLKPITIELPVEVDDKEKDTDLVVVLDYKQYAVKGTSKDDVFAVDIKDVALLHIRRVFLNMRETIKKEFLVGYGKRVPCNILTYIDDTSRDSESQIFVTEILDTYAADTEVETKRSSGIIEVKKSRSKDVFLQRGDLIRVEIDGQMRITEAMSEEEQTICFLPGCSNSVSFHTEVKRDPEKLPDAMLFFKTEPEQSIIHTLAILTRDLCEQATEEITARSGSNSAPNENKKNEKREEAAVNILKMESLMTLARELTLNEARELGIQLGLKPDVLKRIQEETEKDRVASNFQILCKWRGSTCVLEKMALFLIQYIFFISMKCFKTIFA
ncbi:hypothetical protein MAR_006887 [Mya arenaria]|uniref:Death domain-containing protein n=1 Tax=Mya arenaria TaxID=6604 RepID=A0ABY7DCV1_MYAAR|nr:hypothetical protein MAR_006887 [Mya arenaria]